MDCIACMSISPGGGIEAVADGCIWPVLSSRTGAGIFARKAVLDAFYH